MGAPTFTLTGTGWRSPGYGLIPTAPVVTPPTGALELDRSDYPAGWEDWTPITWRPSTGRQLRLNNSTDYLVYCPERFINLTDKLELIGGRNYIVFGLDVTMQCNFGNFPIGAFQGDMITDPGSIKNVGLYVYGRQNYGTNTESVFRCLEGFRVRSGSYISEGVNYRSNDDKGPDSRFMVQNMFCGPMSWIRSGQYPDGRFAHYGGDIHHVQSGPGRTIIRGLTCPSITYQGIFWQPVGYSWNGADTRELQLTRVDITGDRTTTDGNLMHSQMLWDTQQYVTSHITRPVDRVYLDPRPERLSRQRDYMNSAHADQITFGPNPNGPFVPEALTGVDYPYIPNL